MVLKQLNIKILISIFLKPCIPFPVLPHFDFMPLQKIYSSNKYWELMQERWKWWC